MTHEKILIVGPAWVGDMVMAQSLFKMLKFQQANATIDVIAPAWSRGLLERMPEVNASWVLPFQHGEFNLKGRYQLGKSLREQKYTQAIVLPNSLKSVLVPFFANIPLRTGWKGEWPRSLLLNDARRLDKAQLPLMVERFIALAEPPLTRLTPGLDPGSSAVSRAEGYIPKNLRPLLNISSATREAAVVKHRLSVPERLMIMAPGAEFGPSKRWPSPYYAEVAKAKIEQGWGVWLLGSPKDQPIAKEIVDLTQQRAIDLTGKTSLAEAIDLMSLATTVVTNDSGLMHIAAAVGRPIVAVYGSTSSEFTPPLADQVEIVSLSLPCSPCFKRVCPLGHWRCMQDLQPRQVLGAVDRLVSQ